MGATPPVCHRFFEMSEKSPAKTTLGCALNPRSNGNLSANPDRFASVPAPLRNSGGFSSKTSKVPGFLSDKHVSDNVALWTRPVIIETSNCSAANWVSIATINVSRLSLALYELGDHIALHEHSMTVVPLLDTTSSCGRALTTLLVRPAN